MIKRSHFLIFPLFFIGYFLTYLLLNISYISSGLLFHDDTILLPKALFHLPEYPHSPILYFLIDIVSRTQSPDFLKIVFLVIHSISIATISIILLYYLKSITLAVVFALAIGSIPIAADQIIFVTGSHPTLAIIFIFLALLLFDRTRGAVGVTFIFAHLGVLAILFGAAFSSPIAFLAPVALPIWLVVAWSISGESERSSWEWLAALVISILLGFIVYVWTGLGSYHYAGIVGWTEFTPSRVLQNLFSGALRTSMIYGDARSTTFLLFLVGAVIAIAAFVHQWWTDRTRPTSNSHKPSLRSSHLLILGLNALVASALTFGPGSITTNLIDRYLVAPVILGLVAVVALTLYFFKPLTGWRRVAALGFLVLVVGLNISRTQQNIDNKFAAHLRTHNAVSELVEREAQRWPANAQVVMLTEQGYATPTAGYNHWSTWYLRYMTENLNILGLLGPVALVKEDPFVDRYRDHGREYWEVTGGRSRRIQMIGLEIQRPLFVYQQDEAGKFKPFDYVAFTGDKGIRYVQFGSSYNDSDLIQLGNLCHDERSPHIFMWPSEANFRSPRSADHINLIDADKVVFNGTEAMNLNIEVAEGEYFRIDFRLSSATSIDSLTYDNTNPPMPMLTPAFAIYQQPSGFRLSDRHAPRSWDIAGKESSVDIFFEGVVGCVVMVGANDKVIGMLESQSVNGNWLLGRGFLERYWPGNLEDMYLAR